MPTPIGELIEASTLCERMAWLSRSAGGLAAVVDTVAAYLDADTASFRSLTIEQGRPAADVVIQVGLPSSVEDAYRMRYFSLDPALRLLRRSLARPIFPHPKKGGSWQHEHASAAALARYRDDFARYRREFLLPNHMCHHVGFCVPDPLGRALLFDFHRPARMPTFGSLELARARLIATFIQANPAWLGRDGASGSEPEGRHALSRREIEIAQAVAQGLSNKEVAAMFAISVRTVENHVRAVFRKLGVNTRTRLAAKLHRRASTGNASSPLEEGAGATARRGLTSA
jgi:DNA-binding CsgD family transcriptional regulator